MIDVFIQHSRSSIRATESLTSSLQIMLQAGAGTQPGGERARACVLRCQVVSERVELAHVCVCLCVCA